MSDTADKIRKLSLDAARNRKEAIDNLADLEPVIKDLMLNWNKHLSHIKEEVDDEDN